MKNLILLLILFVSSYVAAQTPFTITSSHEGMVSTNGYRMEALGAVSSLSNPWVGAKLAYNISGDVSESFLLSARVLYIAAEGERYAFPIVGNVGLNNDTLSSDNGVSIGVFPYYNLNGNERIQLLLHGGLNYHILNKQDAPASTEFRMLAGLEIALFPSDYGSPFTLSVAPEYVLKIDDTNTNTWGLGITGVVPVANGLGLLLEGNIPFENGTQTAGVKIGVIVNAPID